jgi:hypothetical protein
MINSFQALNQKSNKKQALLERVEGYSAAAQQKEI